MEGKSYLDLRGQLAERDRSLREKVMSLEEAAALVKDGDSVGVGGSTLSRTPMAMIWALIRANRKHLSVSRSIVSSSGSSPATLSGSLMIGLKKRLFKDRISTA